MKEGERREGRKEATTKKVGRTVVFLAGLLFFPLYRSSGTLLMTYSTSSSILTLLLADPLSPRSHRFFFLPRGGKLPTSSFRSALLVVVGRSVAVTEAVLEKGRKVERQRRLFAIRSPRWPRDFWTLPRTFRFASCSPPSSSQPATPLLLSTELKTPSGLASTLTAVRSTELSTSFDLISSTSSSLPTPPEPLQPLAMAKKLDASHPAVYSPPRWAVYWLALSSLVVCWDISYVLLRYVNHLCTPSPVTRRWLTSTLLQAAKLRRGRPLLAFLVRFLFSSLSTLALTLRSGRSCSPYKLYGTVDLVYGPQAFKDNYGFTAAQSSSPFSFPLHSLTLTSRPAIMNVFENILNITALVLFSRKSPLGVLVAYSAVLMTFAKTVLYWLVDWASGWAYTYVTSSSLTLVALNEGNEIDS
jgi:hypothetical protein